MHTTRVRAITLRNLSRALELHPSVTVCKAEEIIAMNPSNPERTAICVRSGCVLGVGTLEQLTGWGDCVLDDTSKDKVIVPGIVEAHVHILEGAMRAFGAMKHLRRPALSSYGA